MASYIAVQPAPLAERAAPSIRERTLALTIAELGMYGLVIILPLAVSTYTYDFFDLPKVTALRLLTVIILGTLALRALRRGRASIVRSGALYSLLLFGTVLILATLQSTAPSLSLHGEYGRFDGLYTYINYVILCVLAANILHDWGGVRRLTFAMCGAGAVAAALGILERLGISPLGADAVSFFGGRVFGTFGNPDFAGSYLAMLAPVAASLICSSDRRSTRAMWAITTTLMLSALVLTMTRGAWIGFALGSLVLLLEARRLWQVRLWLVIVVVVSAVLVLALTLRPAPDASRANADLPDAAFSTGSARSELVNRLTSAPDLEEGSIGNRMLYWRDAFKLFLENPVLGSGLSTYHPAVMKVTSVEYVRGEGLQSAPDKPHNQYLQWLATTGALGLLAYLVVLGAILWAALSWLRSARGHPQRMLMVGLLAGWLAYLVQDFFIFGVIGTASQWWILSGMILAASTIGKPLTSLSLSWPRPIPLVAVGTVVVLVGTVYVGAQSVRPFVADRYFSEGQFLLHLAQADRASFDDSIGQLELANAWFPDQEHYLSTLGTALSAKSVKVADERERRALLDQAVRVFTTAINSSPLDASLYLSRGKTYALYKDDHLYDAYLDYRRAVEARPNDYYANAELAGMATRLGRLDEAIAAQRRMLSVFPHDELGALGLAQNYLNTGRIEEAAGVLDRLLKVAQDPRALLMRAQIYEGKGLRQEAIADYKSVLQSQPGNSYALQGLDRLGAKEEVIQKGKAATN